jgi:hypothetical protein
MALSSESFVSQLCRQNHLVLCALKDSANEVGQRRVLALHPYGDPPLIVTKADIKAIPREKEAFDIATALPTNPDSLGILSKK